MEVCGEAFLHSDWRTSPAYVTGNSEKILHRYHLYFLVAGNLRQCLKVYFGVARNDAYDVPCPVSMQDQCLENLCDILPQAVGDMLCRQVVLIKFVWDKPIFYTCLVKQSCCVCLFYHRSVCNGGIDMNLKQIITRYRVFLILFAVNLVISLVMPEIGLTAFSNTAGNIKEMISVIPPIFILLGLLDVWVDRATMMKYTGKGSGIKGILISFLLGSAAAGPLYAAFPVATVMLKKGSSIFNVLIFLGAWSTTKIPLLTFEAASLGMRFMLTRLALSVIGILMIALITDKTLSQDEREEIYNMQA